MRYVVAFVFVLALVASPLGVSAESEGATPPPSAAESLWSLDPPREEPALQLELDEAGAAVVEMQRRVRNARIGLGISLLSVCVGAVLVPVALRYGIFPDDPYAYTTRDDRIGIASLTLLTGGILSSLATGILLSVRKRTLRSHQLKLREFPLGVTARSQLFF